MASQVRYDWFEDPVFIRVGESKNDEIICIHKIKYFLVIC